MFHVKHTLIEKCFGNQPVIEKSDETLGLAANNLFGEGLSIFLAQFRGHVVDQKYRSNATYLIEDMSLCQQQCGCQNLLLST